MAKNVFKPQEIMYISRKVFIEPPKIVAEEPAEEIEALEEEREYTGPTIEDLRREAEEFRRDWEQEKQRLLEKALAEGERIRKDAEKVAFDEVKRKNNQAQKIRQDAEDDAQKVLAGAREKAEALEGDIKQRVAQTEREAYERGYTEGHQKGYEEGTAEVGRLVERLHTIITKAIEKRNEIIEESETQIINLVLMIVKKVIKVISENQKNVVINNVVQALRKLKSRGDVVIRVNLADLELTSEHVKDFMKMVENVKSITVLEDSSVDRGGCVIETDFGQIDARVSSQLHEIEEKILELMPIRSKGE
ncbi:MAG: flagellar assembly protein FliH [Acidobacteria bacterium]|nr:flagellar assembly protein FliH [Acidobacteriota bacterium]